MKKTKTLFAILVTSLIFSLMNGLVAFAEDPPSISISLEAPPSVDVDLPEDDPVAEPEPEPEPEPISDPAPTYEYTSTASTGPGVLLYAALPALGLLCKRKQNKHGER